jgi:hypothetical protein
MFKKKKAKITPVEYVPVVPDGWSVDVREQKYDYSTRWEYRANAPERVYSVLGKPSYRGHGFKTRYSAIVAAVDMAEFVERELANRYVKWETV